MAEIRSSRQGPLTHLYAYVVELEDGSEGVLRRDTPYGTQPWVGDDRAFMESVREFALRSAAASGRFRRVKLVRFARVGEETVVEANP